MLIVKEDRQNTTMAVEKDKKKMKSIILYLDNMAAINCLSDASAGRIFKSILEYANTGILPELEEEGIKALFMMFAAQIDRDTEAYITKCEKNAENARKRYEARALTNACDGKPPQANGCLSKSNTNSKNNSNSSDNRSNEQIIKGDSAPIVVGVETDYPFEKVWALYDKPVGDQVKLRSMWNALTEEDRKQCYEYICNYVQIRTQQYRKNFENFITLRTWINEPIRLEANETHIKDITTYEEKRDITNAAIGVMQRLFAENQPISEK